MATNNKPVKYMSGTVVSIDIGSPALVKTAEGTVKTSVVLHYERDPKGNVTWFETKHTLYHMQ